MEQTLLDAVLDSWDRSNRILINLLRSVPEGGLTARALPGSPTVSEMFTHMHHERMISVAEEAPEFAGETPVGEWVFDPDAGHIEELLTERPGSCVQQCWPERSGEGEPMALHYDHPILLLQLLQFHEAYHHGQIKLALKAAGTPVADDTVGPLTWDVWRRRSN
jgi:hypothetical protein